MAKTIMLIHGAWLNAHAWEGFKARYEARGYTVIAPSWPLGADKNRAECWTDRNSTGIRTGWGSTPEGQVPSAQTQLQETEQQTADAALPAAEPIAGPVPLPRHRPRSLAMLQSGVPMPRPRPEGAGSTASEGSATPLGWLQKLFTPQQQ